MKVLDLRCANGHGFEGWFASADDYEQQNGRGGVQCPLCGDHAVTRLPSAPRLNLSGARASTARAPSDGREGAERGERGEGDGGEGRRPRAEGLAHRGTGSPVPAAAAVGAASAGSAAPDAPASAMLPAELQARFLRAVREMVTNTEDVGTRFPEEARRIHHGEAPNRGIRGQATPEEREALRDEGIETFQLPVPRGFDGPLQ